MPNLATVLKSEIKRLSRKESKSLAASLKKASAQYRRDIAELKREVASLQKQVDFLKSQERGRIAEKPKVADSDKPLRFSATWLKSHRKKVGLSGEDYAKLVGVSALSIYGWEKGKTKPRAAQVAALSAVRGLGKREAKARLEVLEGA